MVTLAAHVDCEMFVGSLGDPVAVHTYVGREKISGIVGDPCQAKSSLRTVTCTSSLNVACGSGKSDVEM